METMQRPTNTHSGNPAAHTPLSGRKEGLMASTINSSSTFEAECREFAREFNTPSVRSAIALCEAGRLGWAEVYEVFRRSLAVGLEAVK